MSGSLSLNLLFDKHVSSNKGDLRDYPKAIASELTGRETFHGYLFLRLRCSELKFVPRGIIPTGFESAQAN